jgi:LmbE family N-acetylglucosaminyl deacetylase
LFLADGTGSRGADQKAAGRRAQAARNAASALGASELSFLQFPDNRLDGVDLLDIVQAIEPVIEKSAPGRIYTHHVGDLNIDHVLCHHAVLTACRPISGSSVRRIYGMEIPSSTEWSSPDSVRAFLPTRFVDISATAGAKRRALEAYAEEMRPFPHPRSFEALDALAAWRGASAGLNAAEAFTVIREIEP